MSRGLMPYAFLLPAVGLITLMLLYPTIQTINYSFANADSTEYVGLENYRDIFSDSEFWQAIFNNILWLIIVPAVTVFFGLIVAVLADKLSTSGEKVSKSFIFLPMAISFVGASAIWSLVYAYDPPNEPATGLLNAVWRLLGGEPQTWLQVSDLPAELLPDDGDPDLAAGRVRDDPAVLGHQGRPRGDPRGGADRRRHRVPDLHPGWSSRRSAGTIITVFITVVILVLKVFDIVYVLTDGRDKTQVIANLFFAELFRNSQAGLASAIVVVLLIAVTPVLIYQVRHFRREEMGR